MTVFVDLHLDPRKSYTLGIISDTHIPDRDTQLNPRVLSILQEAQVCAIFHAGDISRLSVLDEFRGIAPVYAVQGNRDFWSRNSLPMAISIQAGDVCIGLTHGHGGFWRYFADKLQFILRGGNRRSYQGYYHQYLRSIFPDEQVIIYGHTHFTDETWVQGCLFFNPGAAGPPSFPGLRSSMGLLHLGPHHHLSPQLIDLSS